MKVYIVLSGYITQDMLRRIRLHLAKVYDTFKLGLSNDILVISLESEDVYAMEDVVSIFRAVNAPA